jgi:hypothetical protein
LAQSCHFAKSNKCSGFGNSPCTIDAVCAASLHVVGDVVLAALPDKEARLTRGAR